MLLFRCRQVVFCNVGDSLLENQTMLYEVKTDFAWFLDKKKLKHLEMLVKQGDSEK
jgi:hypothetical protein